MSRIVIISHSHPRLRLGGGEVAAYRQFEELRRQGADVCFVGATIGPDHGLRTFGDAGWLIRFANDDFCVRGEEMPVFSMEHEDSAYEERILRFLLSLDGDIYHFHHFWNIGAGVIRRLRHAKPDAKFLCTVHEMTALCALHGQMVRSSGELCQKGSPLDCATCMPEFTPFNFVARQRRMIDMFACFHTLIAPSKFLADRITDWAPELGKVHVLENGMDVETPPVNEMPVEKLVTRFGFFGQATPTKGLNILLEAADILEKRRRKKDPKISIELNGVSEQQVLALIGDDRVPKSVRPRGRYQPNDAVKLMAKYGCIIIPSTWWENSPVVIQEARAANTPMIASDIGGMLEKCDGWSRFFRVGDAEDLAECIGDYASDPELMLSLRRKISTPLTTKDYVREWRKFLQ